MPTVVLADSAGVTITASGFVVGVPGGFTLTYISDYEIGVSWVKGTGAVNTMVRAKYGSIPTSRTDGYLIYYGEGTSATDTGINLDETVSQVYYRAWSQNAGGVWEETGISDFIEGGGMTLIAFLIFAGILSFLGIRSSYYILKFLAGLAWWALALYWINSPPSTITKGSSVDTVVVVLLFIIGLAFMFMTFWTSKVSNGQETGGRLRLPFMKTDEQEEELRRGQTPPRQERNAAYAQRVRRALGGRIERRKY